MELNELRQLWNHQAEDELAPISEQGIARMLAQKSESVVTRLRRNAWWEVGFIVCLVIALPFGIAHYSDPFMKGYLLVFEVLSIASFYYYYRKFKLLRRMDQVEQNVRGHLETLILGLRGLLAIYLRFTLWLTIVALVAVTSYNAFRFTLKYDGEKLFLSIGVLLLVTSFMGAIMYWLMLKFTKWYLQKLYGQHLDRLEGYLQELGGKF